MMKGFLKSQDENASCAVTIGWKHHAMKDSERDEVLKPKNQRSIEDKNLFSTNSKALYLIFSAVDQNQYKLISTCESAKDAWDILETAHKDTKLVKKSRI